MGRKPYKKILLSDEEYKVVNKIAHWTRVDESWFDLADRILSMADQTPQYTAVWDMERKHWVSLQFGLKLLRESFGGREDEDFVKENVLNKRELKVWQSLWKRIW